MFNAETRDSEICLLHSTRRAMMSLFQSQSYRRPKWHQLDMTPFLPGQRQEGRHSAVTQQIRRTSGLFVLSHGRGNNAWFCLISERYQWAWQTWGNCRRRLVADPTCSRLHGTVRSNPQLPSPRSTATASVRIAVT